MKKQFFIANWKSHKTVEETEKWLEAFQVLLIRSSQDIEAGVSSETILCPPFPLLPLCHQFIHKHHIALGLGSQDISPFAEGAYTGEVSGKLIREFAEYAIIGHSERRKYNKETIQDLAQKVAMSLSFGITPVYCVSEKEEKIPQGVKIVAYEPLAAIGSGVADSPEDAESVAGFIKQNNSVLYVLYGGSVTAENVAQYTQLPSINGVLVGGASLSPDDFAKLIDHA